MNKSLLDIKIYQWKKIGMNAYKIETQKHYKF